MTDTIQQATTQQATTPAPVVNKLPSGNKNTILIVVFSLIVVLAGVATGWLISGNVSGGSSSVGEAAPGVEVSSNEAGSADESAFPDNAEGVLERGGIKGEGTHHLVRGEDESQYVYLTSTVIDLESFSGKKVKIWGETLSAESAGWMMDVGKVKVIE